MTDEQNKINEAFENLPGPYLLPKERQQISEKYGAAIAAQVKAIYDAATDIKIDWQTATMDSALGTMHEMLRRDYPWLSDKARTEINYAFIMTWR